MILGMIWALGWFGLLLLAALVVVFAAFLVGDFIWQAVRERKGKGLNDDN